MEIKRSITITNEEETKAFGLELGKNAKEGQVIALIGDLGTGKTTLTKYIAEGLGVTETISSPTYTIVNEYLSGKYPLFHFDMYRLASSDDLFDIGWEDYLDRGGICAVEWSENVADAMEDAIVVTIEKLGEDARRITIEGGESLADTGI
jgi:tRNA threonylcarbamoyladenosine biosynthesis protein TsaE